MKSAQRRRAVCVASVVLLLAAATREGAVARPAAGVAARQTPFVVRPFRPTAGARWIGEAIAYGPHRDGQSPNGASPSLAQVREDLALMAPHWQLLRVYGATGATDTVLAAIRADHRDMKVLLGVWIDAEDRRDSTGAVIEQFPAARASNRREVEAAVRLVRAYPHRIAAICAGNETQVSWSAHRVAPTLLIGYIRELRARTAAPVTTADDLNYWTTPASRVVAREVDFVCTHLHPLWAGQTLDDALPWMKRQYAAVHALHPARTLVIGETGWATGKLSSGEQSTLMKGQPDEAAQAAFCHAAAAWIHREHITTFFFEAFDENWKGGPDPADAEKHWGFFHADRTPKPVVRHAEN